MHLSIKKYFPIFALSLITSPICAAHTNSALWEPAQPMTIGDIQVDPGKYQLKIDEDLTDLQVIQGGKVIATVLCYWADLPQKAADTEVKVNNNRVTEVQFKGRSAAIRFFS